MELLISAASTRQLVIGKAIGIGLAGATQTTIVLVPALLVLARRGPDRHARPRARASGSRRPCRRCRRACSSRSPCSTCWLRAVLARSTRRPDRSSAGPRTSRSSPCRLTSSRSPATGMALLALTGGITGFIRLASYVPFWSPFVMLTRLSVGRVEPWELALSVALLVATIGVVGVVAIRIYGAGRPALRPAAGLRAPTWRRRRGTRSRRVLALLAHRSTRDCVGRCRCSASPGPSARDRLRCVAGRLMPTTASASGERDVGAG